MATITRKELADAIRERLPGVTQPEAMRLFNEALEEIASAAASGEKVKLSGFGVFAVRAKRERIGRNPMTLAGARISARRVMTFHPSLLLRAAVNEPGSRRPASHRLGGGEPREAARAESTAPE